MNEKKINEDSLTKSDEDLEISEIVKKDNDLTKITKKQVTSLLTIDLGSIENSINTYLKSINVFEKFARITGDSLNIFQKYSNVVRDFIKDTNKLNPFNNLKQQNGILGNATSHASHIKSTLRDTKKILKSNEIIWKMKEKLKKSSLFLSLKEKAVNLKNKLVNKAKMTLERIKVAFSKIQLKISSAKLAVNAKIMKISKGLLVTFAKILIPIIAIVAAIKIIMRAARFLGRIFGRRCSGDSGDFVENYDIPTTKPAFYSGIQPSQMTMPLGNQIVAPAAKGPVDYFKIQQSIKEGAYQGMMMALRENSTQIGQDHTTVLVQIDSEDVRARIERRKRDSGISPYRGMIISGKH